MELKNFFAQDAQGNVIPSPTAYLYLPTTTTIVNGLQDALGAPLTNPFTGTIQGQIQLAAPDGEYDLRVVGAGRDFTMRVRFLDASLLPVAIAAKDQAVAAAALAQAAAQYRVSIACATYAALAAVVGTANQSAVVFGDAGTHTDPVTSTAGVANSGVYRYSASPAGWQRLANLEAADAATSASAAAASLTTINNTLVGTSLPRTDGVTDSIAAFGCDDYGMILWTVTTAGLVAYAAVSATTLTGTTVVGGTVQTAQISVPATSDPFDLSVQDDYGCIRFELKSDGSQNPAMADTSEIATARGSRSTLDVRVGQGLDAYGNLALPFIRPEALRDWRTKRRLLVRGDAVHLVLGLIGDSWRERFGDAPQYVGGPGQTRLALIAAYGNRDGGNGWLPFGGATTEMGSGAIVAGYFPVASAAKTGTWAYQTTYGGRGPDMKEATSTTTGDKITISIKTTPASTSKLCYLRKAAGGDFRWRVNGGSWTTVATANASDALGTVDIPVPANASAGTTPSTIEIENVTGSVTLFGADHRHTAGGVVVHRLGAAGSTAAHWQAASANAVVVACWAALGVDAWDIMLGTNDQGGNVATATFKTQIAALVTALRTTRAGADVILEIPFENLRANTIPMASYRDALLQCAAENRCAAVDFVRLAGPTSDYDTASPRAWITSADNIHPQPAGYLALADGTATILTSN